MRRLIWLLIGLATTVPARADEPAQEKPFLVLDAGGHTAMVNRVFFTNDGKELITVSDDKTIRFWDVASGDPLRVLRPPIGLGKCGMLFTGALSPDGQRLAVGGYGLETGVHNIYLISLVTGKLETVFKGHANVIYSLAYSPDGRRLASGSGEHTARIWNVETGETEHVLEGHSNDIYAIGFSPDGLHLATGSFDKTTRIWNVATGQLEHQIDGHDNRVHCLAWSPDGTMLVTGGRDEPLKIWNPDGTPHASPNGLGSHYRALTSLVFSSDSRRLLAAGEDADGGCCSSIFDIQSGKQLAHFAHSSTVMHGAFSPDGDLVATTGGSDDETFLWKQSDGKVVHKLVSQGRNNFAAGWSPDGKTVLWGPDWEGGDVFAATTKLQRSFNLVTHELGGVPEGAVRRAQLERGSTRLVRASKTTVDVQQNGRTITTLKLTDPYEEVYSATLLPGDQAVVCTIFGIYLFDTRDGKRLRDFRGHTGVVWATAPSPDGRYFLSASGDQTIRIWDPERDDPLLSLFFAGDDWIAWTPEGYYASSPGGEHLMGWHLNNGHAALATFHPAAQFHKSLYRPDAIKLLLRAGSVQRALEILGEQASTTLVENLPPSVFIITPEQSGIRLNAPELEVRAVARGRDQQPVQALRLLVDGRPYGGLAGQKAIPQSRVRDKDVRESWTITLTPGVHRLAVQAESAVSKAVSDEIEVIYDRPGEAKPRLYVLAVGISAYPGTLRLNYGAKDAEVLDEVLRGKAGGVFASVQTKVLTDEHATRRNIISGLAWLKRQMTDQDVGVIFYSGHGAQDDDGTFYLVPIDVDTADLAGTALHGSQFKTTLAGIRGRVVVLLDACHAGAVEGGRRKGIASLTDDLVRELVSDDYGIVVMCSSTGREVSRESDDLGQGYFTKALTEGLLGRADFNRDGLVYVTELDTYVSDRVKELTKDTQHPVTAKPTSVRPFALTKP